MKNITKTRSYSPTHRRWKPNKTETLNPNSPQRTSSNLYEKEHLNKQKSHLFRGRDVFGYPIRSGFITKTRSYSPTHRKEPTFSQMKTKQSRNPKPQFTPDNKFQSFWKRTPKQTEISPVQRPRCLRIQNPKRFPRSLRSSQNRSLWRCCIAAEHPKQGCSDDKSLLLLPSLTPQIGNPEPFTRKKGDWTAEIRSFQLEICRDSKLFVAEKEMF